MTTTIDDSVLGRTSLALPAELTIWRNVSETNANGSVSRFTVHAALVDHPRYEIAVHVGHGRAMTKAGLRDVTTMATMVGHDLPVPVVDRVAYRRRRGDDVRQHLHGSLAGLRALRDLHLSAGDAELATLYREVESGFELLIDELAGVLPDDRTPIANQTVVTSMPGTLQFLGPLEDPLDTIVQVLPDVEIDLPFDVPEDELLSQASCFCGCYVNNRCKCCACGKNGACRSRSGCSCKTCDCPCGCGCCGSCTFTDCSP